MTCPHCGNPNAQDDGADCYSVSCVERRRSERPALQEELVYNCNQCFDNGFLWDGTLCTCAAAQEIQENANK